MQRQAFRKYTIGSEKNPVWQIAEPAILRTWAQGILGASYRNLYLANLIGIGISLVSFLGSVILRSIVVGVLLGFGLILFGDGFRSVLLAPFAGPSLDPGQHSLPQWLHTLAGYAVLIKSILFVFGTNLTTWGRDTGLYSLFLVTGMVPLRLIAKGLLRENYFAQLIAKSPFMGMYMAGTIGVAPPEFERRYDRLFDLYSKSNDDEKRRELELLCQEILDDESLDR